MGLAGSLGDDDIGNTLSKRRSERPWTITMLKHGFPHRHLPPSRSVLSADEVPDAELSTDVPHDSLQDRKHWFVSSYMCMIRNVVFRPVALPIAGPSWREWKRFKILSRWCSRSSDTLEDAREAGLEDEVGGLG
jgi:hypothetical protein